VKLIGLKEDVGVGKIDSVFFERSFDYLGYLRNSCDTGVRDLAAFGFNETI
jgi:hypothetical protein